MEILFLGPSGSGKDTQAELLLEVLSDTIVFSTGEMFRKLEGDTSERAVKALDYMNKGLWVPDDLVYELLEEKLTEITTNNIIFTGAVRTPAQVPLFENALNRSNRGLEVVFYVEISDDEAMRRLLLRNRGDDTEELIKNRLKEFHTNNDPIVEAYKQKGILETINGERPIEAIQADIRSLLKSKYELTIA